MSSSAGGSVSCSMPGVRHRVSQGRAQRRLQAPPEANAEYGIGADRYRGRTNYCRGGVRSMRVAGFSHGAEGLSSEPTADTQRLVSGYCSKCPWKSSEGLKRTAPNRTVLFKLKRDQEAGRATAT